MKSLHYAICAGALVVLGATSAGTQEPKRTIMPEDTGALAFQEVVGYPMR